MPAPFLRRAVLLLALFSPALASAQKPPPAGDASRASTDRQATARGLALEGLKLFGADRYAEALATFREADALFHAPSVTLYIARCQRKMGKLLDARATYDRLLAEDLPKDASPQFVQAHVEGGQELEGLKQKIPTLRVLVTGVPVGEAQVTLEGVLFAEGTKELDPGRYNVEVRRVAVPGGSSVARAVALSEGDHKTITFDLGAGGTSVEASRWYLPGAVTLGAGALVLGVGAITGAVSLAKTSTIKGQCMGTMCPVRLAGDAATAKDFGYVSDVGFAVGAAAAVAGGVLLYTSWRREQRAPAQGQAGWGLSVGVGRVDVGGRF